MSAEDVGKEFLSHYGVLGMKWGVRKDRKSSKARTRYSKSPSRLTDDELKRRVSRMETEKRYNELNRRDVSTGEKMAVDIVKKAGDQTITKVLAGASFLAVTSFLSAKFGPDLVKDMFPKKK